MARLNVSQKERILLQLLELDRYRDEAEVPMGACQEGLSTFLQTQVHNTSRSLSALQEEGLVWERLAHVRGAGRRRRAYFLTEKGSRAASSLVEHLMTAPVTVDTGGGGREMTLGEVLRAVRPLAGRSVSLAELVQAAGPEGLVEVARLGRREHGASSPASRSVGRPVDPLFRGRERELSLIKEALAGNRTVVIWGLPGIGKSALGSRAFEDVSSGRPAFWYTIRDWDTRNSFLRELMSYLRSQGLTEASEAFSRGRDPADLFPGLVGDLSRWRGVLFLDDVHKASGDLATVLNLVVEASRAKGSTGTVVMSRARPLFVPPHRPDVMDMELAGLEETAAVGLAREMGIADAEGAVRISHGHPLLLRLTSRGSGPVGSVGSFIGEVWSALGPAEQEVLETLSVFRTPVGMDALTGTDSGTIASLRHRGIILEEEGWRVHELVRDSIYELLPLPRRSELHALAAQHYSRGEDGRSALEALHHAVQGEDHEMILALLEQKGDAMIEEGPEEVWAALERVPSEKSATLRYWRAETATALGWLEVALEEYHSGLEMADREDASLRGRFYEGLAHAQKDSSRLHEAVAAHHSALTEYQRQGNRVAQAREWLSLGGLYRKMGELAKARQSVQAGMDILPHDRSVQAAGINNLAMIDWEDGAVDRAEEGLRASARLARQVKDYSGEGRALDNLAQLYRHRLQMEGAATALREASASHLRAGRPDRAARSLVRGAGILAELGRTEEALGHIQRFMDLLPRKPSGQAAEAFSAALLASLEMHRSRGDFRTALREGQEGLTSLRGEDRARLLTELALAHDGLGETAQAQELLVKAEDILRSLDSTAGLTAVLMRRGMLEEKEGNLERAVASYREALWQSERSADARGEAVARENLGLALGLDTPEGQDMAKEAVICYQRLGLEGRAARLRSALEKA